MLSFPYSTNQQVITDLATSLQRSIQNQRRLGWRTAFLNELFDQRVHELMRHRPHNQQEEW